MGRESSHGRKELLNLPPLVLKARAPNDGSAFCIGFSRLEVPEQTLGGIPLGLGMVMKINFFEFSCKCTSKCTCIQFLLERVLKFDFLVWHFVV